MEHKYTLEPYKSGGSNRYTCPSCGKKKCFTRYVNADTGEYIDDSCGKCNHELSCGYHYTPKDYYREHPQLRDFPSVHTSNPLINNMKKEKAERPICYVDPNFVTQSHSPNSQFMKWIESAIGRPDDIQRVFEEYRIGATRDGGVIFWQIDHEGKVRTGKIMHYWNNGHRVQDEEDYARMRNQSYTEKSPSPTVFIHSVMKSKGMLSKDWQLTQCLFGEHLLKGRSGDIVCLVESEKSAIICSIFYPQFVWLATGGSNGLNKFKLKPLKGRRVIIYPDSGELETWRKIMSQTQGIDYSIVDNLEAYEHNTDIADIILMKTNTEEKTLPQESSDTATSDTVRHDSEGLAPQSEIEVFSSQYDIEELPPDIFMQNDEPCPF